MFTLKPGWTKKKVMAIIKKYNNDTKSTNMDGGCVYFGYNNRCVIGCFLPEKYKDKIDNNDLTVEKLLRKFPELIEHMPFTDSAALETFQNVHDCCPNIGSVYKRIQDFLDTKVSESKDT